MNQGFGKDVYRKGNSVKRFGPFTKPPDSGKFRLPVSRWDRFRCTVEPSPGHIRCRVLPFSPASLFNLARTYPRA